MLVLSNRSSNQYSRYKDDPSHVLEASIDFLELGRRIRSAREINGRSQEAFADVCRLKHRTKLIAHLFVDRSDNLLIGNHI